jgi:hypothetical protein
VTTACLGTVTGMWTFRENSVELSDKHLLWAEQNVRKFFFSVDFLLGCELSEMSFFSFTGCFFFESWFCVKNQNFRANIKYTEFFWFFAHTRFFGTFSELTTISWF